ncbi:hypothetical protein CEXT_400681 [Caerostris extrusa]|uniref:Uncharacterized protein n=1 Tax=Caerostris extrusa TaxID=172846 RepID=A0AAV4UR22_CAEEX|nr:hypothetical protein CEXT_400681 [Caerostris extrusa]
MTACPLKHPIQMGIVATKPCKSSGNRHWGWGAAHASETRNAETSRLKHPSTKYLWGLLHRGTIVFLAAVERCSRGGTVSVDVVTCVGVVPYTPPPFLFWKRPPTRVREGMHVRPEFDYQVVKETLPCQLQCLIKVLINGRMNTY